MLRGFLPPVSNRESFIDDIELVDADDGSIWDLTGVTAKIELRGVGGHQRFTDYSTYFGGGAAPACLLVTTENGGAVIRDLQAIEFTFTLAQMATLCAGQYQLSAVATRDDVTLQLFQYDIPILDGGVPQ